MAQKLCLQLLSHFLQSSLYFFLPRSSRKNAQNRFPLYGFGTILGVFFRYNNGTLFNYLLYFFFLLTTVVPMAAPPLTNSRASHKARLLVSPVCGDLESSFSFVVTVSVFSTASCSAYFVAGVLGIPLVHDVQERREVIVLRGSTVHIVVDGYEPNALFREKDFCVVANLQIVSTKTTEILYHKGLHSSGFDFFQQSGKTGTIKYQGGITILPQSQ